MYGEGGRREGMETEEIGSREPIVMVVVVVGVDYLI
jgi:hypothetical protein